MGTSGGGNNAEVVRVWLLDGFRISVGSRVIGEDTWRLRKAKAMVKLLALSAGHRLHRERVLDLLWPSLGRQAAANNLRQAMHVARRIFDPDPEVGTRYLDSQGELLALCPRVPLWVDVGAFEEAAKAARRSGEPAAYRSALDLYPGELLPADRYEEWAEIRRQELKGEILSLLVELATLYERRGEYVPAIDTLKRALAEEPVSEEAHAGLMRLYSLSGRQGEALKQYERLREVLSETLGTEPDASTRRLREEIAAGEIPGSTALRPEVGSPKETTSDGKHNLTPPRTSFVGRERELVEVKRELAMTSLLTLTGAGGTGKTRLALELARELAPAYRDGAWLVELAGLSEPGLVSNEVAGSLGVRDQPGHPLLDALVDALRSKEMLLILDNCEHLIEACAGLSQVLLDSCPGLRILATSREPLVTEDATSRVVPPLSVPESQQTTVEDLARYASARLFVDRARQRNPTFTLIPDNTQDVAEICRKLDGIPLAIELTAARMDVLALEQITERLDRALGILTGGSQPMEPRHRTLRATLHWSYELLSESERRLFATLAVFAGGFSLEAAEAVGESIEQTDVLESFLALVDKSLVVAVPMGGGAVRYRMLEPIRQYGLELLEESGEVEEVRRRHAEFFLSLAEEAEPELRGPRQGEWLERLELDHDNFRAALSWMLERGEAQLGLRLSGALGELWFMYGHLDEGRRWLEATLASGDEAPARIKALLHAALAAWEQLDYEHSEAFGEEAATLARRLGDAAATARALYILGTTALYQLDFDRASALLEETVALQRGIEDEANLGRTIQMLGLAATARHDFERAAQLHEECLTLARKHGDQLGIILALGMGAFAFLGQGDHRQTRELFKEGLELSQRLGAKHAIVFYLHAAAALASTQGQPVRSARLWGAGEALMREIGTGLAPVERYHYWPYIASARTQLGEAAWQAAWDEGRGMTSEQAVEYALSEEEPVPLARAGSEQAPADKQAGLLTRREKEVVALVARGLTNRQISEELFISERTVDAHVRKVLKKLGLRSRAQVAIWATDQQLASSELS
jgi:predicted ATPase/DNA-binding SARP family transcriptional activator/DNA-binding CsgD family transcriptional regulator